MPISRAARAFEHACLLGGMEVQREYRNASTAYAYVRARLAKALKPLRAKVRGPHARLLHEEAVAHSKHTGARCMAKPILDID